MQVACGPWYRQYVDLRRSDEVGRRFRDSTAVGGDAGEEQEPPATATCAPAGANADPVAVHRALRSGQRKLGIVSCVAELPKRGRPNIGQPAGSYCDAVMGVTLARDVPDKDLSNDEAPVVIRSF